MDLRKIKSILENNRFYTVDKTQESDYPFPSLEVLLDDVESGTFLLQLGYIPQADEQLDHLKLLQFFVPIEEVPQNISSAVHCFLHEINRELAIPGFTVDTDAGLIYYRYIMPISIKFSEDMADEILEMVTLVFFFVSQYADSIKHAVSRSTS
jgi:hypothetical protein